MVVAAERRLELHGHRNGEEGVPTKYFEKNIPLRHEICRNGVGLPGQSQRTCRAAAALHVRLTCEMSSFFTLPASQRKRKRTEPETTRQSKRRGTERDRDAPKPRSRKIQQTENDERDSEISGSESDGSEGLVEPQSDSEASSAEDEHPDDRRVRLAQRYLDNVRQEVNAEGFDAEDLDKDLIAERLRSDVDDVKGRQYRLIAEKLDLRNAKHVVFKGIQTKTTTDVAICSPYVYTVSKDQYLMKWELPSTDGLESWTDENDENRTRPARQRPRLLKSVRKAQGDGSSTQRYGHTGQVLAVAASPDGNYVATGGSDNKLIVWSAATLKPLRTFTVHRDAITALSFSPRASVQVSAQSHDSQLFAASKDRTIKTYSFDPSGSSLAYVETLFGHQDHITDVAAMSIDQAVSVGSRDRTARVWKVVDETQLVFRADSNMRHEEYSAGSVDCVAALPPTHFITGSDSGTISLWTVHKKKPLFTVPIAHGVEEPRPVDEVTSETNATIIAELKQVDRRRPTPRAITALASLSGTDVVVSGSWDGCVRLWRVGEDKKSLVPMGVVGQQDSSSKPAENLPSTSANGVNGDVSDTIMTNGHVNGDGDHHSSPLPTPHTPNIDPDHGPIRGIINSITVFERRKQLTSQFGIKREGDTIGVGIVVGTGKEPRLGRWRTFPEGRNGAVLIEVPVQIP